MSPRKGQLVASAASGLGALAGLVFWLLQPRLAPFALLAGTVMFLGLQLRARPTVGSIAPRAFVAMFTLALALGLFRSWLAPQ